MRTRISPDKDVVAGSTNAWRLIFELDDCEIKKGGGLRVQTPGGVGWSRPQIKGRSSTGGELDGLVTAECSDASIKLNVTVKDVNDLSPTFNPWGKGWSDRWIYIISPNASLKQGTSITLYYGDVRWNASVGARTGIRAGTARFKTWIDRNGAEEYKLIDNFPDVKVCPAVPVRIIPIAPSKINPGEAFDLFVKITDRWNNLVDFDAQKLKIKSINGELAGYTVEQDKSNTCLVKNCSFNSSGVKYIEIYDKGNGLRALSNPIVVDDSELPHKIYWGEMHSHSNISFDVRERVDEDSTPERCYTYAKDVNRLDFSALADHNFFRKLGDGVFLGRFDEKGKMCGQTALSESEWEKAQNAASKFNVPGEYVAFSGYEFRSDEDGDVCMYFKNDNAENFLDHTVMGEDNLENLYKFHEHEDIMATPHLMNSPKHLFPDSPKMPLIEMFSIFGCFEYEGNPLQRPGRDFNKYKCVQDYLIKGYKFGFNAGSDDHEGYPGILGLTGVLSDKLDRDSLWDAFMKRHCYATTGARIYLDFKINGHIMGDEFSCTEDRNDRTIEVSTAASDRINKIEIIRNNKVIHEEKVGSLESSFVYTDSERLEDVELKTPLIQALLFYYVRVTLENKHMAWASPIWVNSCK